MTAIPLIVLVVLNIPVFLVIAWVIFDTKEAAAETVWDTVVAILYILIVPRIIRYMLDLDESGAQGIFPIAGFFIFCIAAVGGEYYLLSRVAPGWFPWPN